MFEIAFQRIDILFLLFIYHSHELLHQLNLNDIHISIIGITEATSQARFEIETLLQTHSVQGLVTGLGQGQTVTDLTGGQFGAPMGQFGQQQQPQHGQGQQLYGQQQQQPYGQPPQQQNQQYMQGQPYGQPPQQQQQLFGQQQQQQPQQQLQQNQTYGQQQPYGQPQQPPLPQQSQYGQPPQQNQQYMQGQPYGQPQPQHQQQQPYGQQQQQPHQNQPYGQQQQQPYIQQPHGHGPISAPQGANSYAAPVGRCKFQMISLYFFIYLSICLSIFIYRSPSLLFALIVLRLLYQ